ncbi:MAG: phosphatidylserine decarboxylase [Deltaproteobacteria bacterium]|nr:MAG: phosphatidylserine decarboxylase [Deltaproteobacteria bacterium]
MPSAGDGEARLRIARWFVDRMPRRAVSRAAGVVANVPVARPLRRPVYGTFARMVGARLDEAAQHVEYFSSFNEFFTRELRPGARPDLGVPGGWVSPADGRLDQFGRVDAGVLVQAKGMHYTASELLQDPGADDLFEGGLFATVYLSPADYHRVHAPCRMEVEEVVHVGGDLYPVNGLSVPYRPGLFARNERVVLRFRDAAGRAGALVLVGATVVGGIRVSCPVSLRQDHRLEAARYSLSPPHVLGRMSEAGRFLLGSTVVLLVQRGDEPLRPVADAMAGKVVRLGEGLFEPLAD